MTKDEAQRRRWTFYEVVRSAWQIRIEGGKEESMARHKRIERRKEIDRRRRRRKKRKKLRAKGLLPKEDS